VVFLSGHHVDGNDMQLRLFKRLGLTALRALQRDGYTVLSFLVQLEFVVPCFDRNLNSDTTG